VKNGQTFHLKKFIWILFQNILKELLYLINNSYCWCLRGRFLCGVGVVLRTYESYMYSSFPTHRTFTLLKWSTGDSKTRQDILTGLPCMW
jgi:hypothetical protein